eukprot:304804-Rhodomonas_salina.1
MSCAAADFEYPGTVCTRATAWLVPLSDTTTIDTAHPASRHAARRGASCRPATIFSLPFRDARCRSLCSNCQPNAVQKRHILGKMLQILSPNSGIVGNPRNGQGDSVTAVTVISKVPVSR